MDDTAAGVLLDEKLDKFGLPHSKTHISRHETRIRYQSLGRVEQRFDYVEARLRREE